MKLADWANVVQVASGVAVVATLLFVGVEINENSRAVLSNTQQQLMDAWRATSTLILTDPNVAALLERAETDPDSLSPVDQRRFCVLVEMRMTEWETSYMTWDTGILTDERWQALDEYYRALVVRPAYEACWRNDKALGRSPGAMGMDVGSTTRFQAYVTALFDASHKPGP
jgi:hypothetical protein